jgi:hypothetical protein
MWKTALYELQKSLKSEDIFLLGIGFVFLLSVIIFVTIANATLILPEKTASISKNEAAHLQANIIDAIKTSDITPASSYRNEFENAWNSLGKAHKEGKRKRKKAFDAMFKHTQERFRRAQENF